MPVDKLKQKLPYLEDSFSMKLHKGDLISVLQRDCYLHP